MSTHAGPRARLPPFLASLLFLSLPALAAGPSPLVPALAAQVPADGGTDASEPGAADGGAALSEEDVRALEEAFGPAGAEAPATPAAPSPAAPSQAAPSAQGTTSGGTLGSARISGPDISLILDVAGAYFSNPEPLQTGGHDPTRNGFNLQQLEMALGAAVDPYLRFDGNLVFSQFGVEIEEAYATTLGLPLQLQARGGQFLTRFGRQNATHPHTWDFVDQPFMLGRVFGSEGNRGLGVELSWLAPLPWSVEVLGSLTDASGGASARSFFGDSQPWPTSPLDFQATGVVKQFFPLSDDLSLYWGLSAATGPNPSGFRTRTDVYGTDVSLRWRPTAGPGAATRETLTLQAEGLWRRRQAPGELLQDWGLYAQSVYRFALRWGVGARYEYGAPAVGEVAGSRAVDPLDPEWTEPRHRVSANLTFWPTEFSRFRLQGAMDAPQWRPQPIYSVFLAGEVVIGAHGAHPF